MSASSRPGATARTVAGLAVFALALALPASAGRTAAQAGSESGLLLARSVSGTRGSASGSLYEIEDPRSVFTVPHDRQIIVYFEWEGEPGRYRIEGRWRDPSGRVVLTAPTDYEAVESRFGVYWTLALPENLASGLWALEAYVGDDLVGSHSFEVRGGRPPQLSAEELYRCAQGGMAVVEAAGASGEPLARGVGTALSAADIATSFATIEAASVIRVRLPGGANLETRELGAWNREEGWAILRVPGHGLTPLPREGAEELGIGGTAFVFDTLHDGSQVIGQTAIVGRRETAPGRAVLRVEDWHTVGSPVIDAQCRLVGLVVGSERRETGPVGVRVGRFLGLGSGPGVLPAQQLPRVTTVATLEELAADGTFVPPLSANSAYVVSGVFAGKIDEGDVVQPRDQRSEFSRRERAAHVFVTWGSEDRLDGTWRFALYDRDNRLRRATEPAKLKLRRNKYQASIWTIPLGQLPPATYRVDLLLDDAPVWRGYLRVTE